MPDCHKKLNQSLLPTKVENSDGYHHAINESTANKLILHFDINETLIIGDDAGGENDMICLKIVKSKLLKN